MLLNISVSNSSRFNAMAYHTDKGTGIKEMIEHFNIKQEDTLVIGIVIMIELCLHLVVIASQ